MEYEVESWNEEEFLALKKRVQDRKANSRRKIETLDISDDKTDSIEIIDNTPVQVKNIEVI